MTSLLQEIISVYTLLNPSQLTAAASNRVCNALALLQCVASHNDTRTLFLNGQYTHTTTRFPTFIADLCLSPYPALPLPFPQYDFKISTVRVFAADVPRCHRRASQERLV